MRAALPALLGALLAACTTGEGTGSVRSDALYIAECWDGPFDLEPTFFASAPADDSQQIRVQRGDRLVGTSDGLFVVVNQVTRIRTEQLDVPIPLGLPIGVTPPGQPRRVATDSPQVSLTLYLYDTCHRENAAVHSVGGSITFRSLFSGDRNENDAQDRLTEAEFEAVVADPRDGMPSEGADGGVSVTFPEGRTSKLVGNFRFYFQRGMPAQPFP